MLGSSGGIKLRIELRDRQEFYTNGDVVRGVLHVESGKSYSVQKIVMKLRCEEFAYVWVPNGQGGYYEIETHRHLSLSSTVFPQRSIRDAHESGTYTLGEGARAFDFEFKIPVANRYPQSLRIKGSESGIRWYVKGSLYRGQLLAANKRAVVEFDMMPGSAIPYAMNAVCAFKAEQHVNTYKEGYAELTRTAAGKFKQLLPGNAQLRLKTRVELSLFVPDAGVQQEPANANIALDLSSPDAALLLVRKVALFLKQKIVVSVNDGWNTSVYRDSFSIAQLDQLDLPLKAAMAKVQDLLQSAKVHGRLPETFANHNFDVSYKIVAEVVVASVEKASAVEKIRISVPAYLHSYTSGPHEPAEPEDALPFYSAEPQVGEAKLG